MTPAKDTSASPPRLIEHRLSVIISLLALALLIAALTVFKMSNNDIWIHLKTGETIFETWQVPQHDPYSFTASDHDYVAHEWLSGLVFYLVYAAGGVNGLIFFKSAVIFITCAALLGACRLLRVPFWLIYPCMALMLFISSARFLERPHIFSYLFTAFYLFAYFAYRNGGRRRIWLLAIPLLHIVWTNMHGGHYQGIFLLVMLAAAEVIMFVRAHRFGLSVDDAIPSRDLMIVCGLPFACLVTAMVNPYGFRLLTFPFELTGKEVFMRSIYEWQSALFPSYNLSAMFLYFIVWIVVLFGSFLLVRGHSELKGGFKDLTWALNVLLGGLWLIFTYELASVYKTPYDQIPTALERHAPFWFGVVGLFLLANLHRLEFQHAGIVALFFALSMRHNRAVTDCAIATLPTLGHNLAVAARRLPLRRGKELLADRPALLWPQAGLMVGLALFTFSNSYYFGFNPSTRREMGLGIASNMPVEAVDYVEKTGITGRAFPSYNAAAMLIHRMWPEVKVAMDSRNDVYGETLYNEYSRALSGGEAAAAYVDKWDIDFFLITYGSRREADLCTFLDESPDWMLVYFDDRAVVYLRTRPKFRNITVRDGYRLISPARPIRFEITPDQAPLWLEEAERGAAAAPDAWTPLQYKSKALMALGRLDEAEPTVRRILSMRPEAYFAWGDLGYIHVLRNERGPAADAFKRCLQIRPNYRPCEEALAYVQGGG